MIAKTTVLVWFGEVQDLKWNYRGWLLHYIGGMVCSLTQRVLNWFIFTLILSGRNLGPRMIKSSALCTILPHNLQMILFWTQTYAMTSWRVDLSLLMEDEVTRRWDLWPKEVIFLHLQSCLDNDRVHEYFSLCI